MNQNKNASAGKRFPEPTKADSANPPCVLLLLSKDLATASQVAGLLQNAAIQTAVATDFSSVGPKTDALRCRWICIDLSTAGVPPPDCVDELRARAPADAEIVAFGPHVHQSRLAGARAAGCDRVLSRGGFFKWLSTLARTEPGGGIPAP